MELRDLIVTPTLLILLYFLAYNLRVKVCTVHTKKYFIPALTIKFFGAILLGLVYQFYYGGGDTFGYTSFGAHYVWEAFTNQPVTGINLIFGDNVYTPQNFQYASRMWYFDDPPAYFIVRLTGLFALFTFDTYSSQALLFATIGFSGLWALYSSIIKAYPRLHLPIAVAIFAVPSVVFWGSGIMKDTITLSAVGWVIYALFEIFFFKNRSGFNYLILFVSIWVISVIKVFILFCLLPTGLIWIYLLYIRQIKSIVLKIIVQPLLLIIPVSISILGLLYLTEGNQRYSFNNLLKTAEITAYDNSVWTVRSEGSGYNLGDYDFSPTGLLRKFIPAVWVTLFRPYLWESNSIVMLLSALESLILLIFTFYLLVRIGLFNLVKTVKSDPFITACLIFTITFAFAVGVSSGNFGSLVRYKIPVIPFYLTALFICSYQKAALKRR